MATQPSIPLPGGQLIPQLGFGLWQVANADAEAPIRHALKTGYRSIDTAQVYQNESAVGRALRASGLARKDIFITTKLFSSHQGAQATLSAFGASLDKLGLEYVDLYLIHWPSPHRNLYVDSWRALLRLQQEGRAKTVGVSNFTEAHLQRLLNETGQLPALNQVELHPRFQQKALRAFHARHGIVTQAWSPLGQGQLIGDPVIGRIARKHGKTPAQIILRWHLDSGHVAIPKSVTPSRIVENFQVFDFRLDDEDREGIEKMDIPSGRIGPNPETTSW
jgi:2,5-diketo-D-gluconate reductase A